MGGDTAWDTLIGWFYSSCVRGAICNSPWTRIEAVPVTSDDVLSATRRSCTFENSPRGPAPIGLAIRYNRNVGRAASALFLLRRYGHRAGIHVANR